jgi:hypothetical protein
MKALKGKNEFTANTIPKLEELIKLRIKSSASEQKTIRRKMRDLGLYGKDDWGITDMQVSDLHSLIKSGRIKIIDGNVKPISVSTVVRKPIPTSKLKTPKSLTTRLSNIDNILNSLIANRFDPKLEAETKIDDCSGNYILCLRKNAKFPTVSISPTFTKFEAYNLGYKQVGLSSFSIIFSLWIFRFLIQTKYL